MDLLEDVSGLMSVFQVSSSHLAGQFSPNEKSRLELGSSASAWWIRFRIKGSVRRWLVEVAKPNLDQVDLFFPTSAGYLSFSAGDDRPASGRDIRARTFVFMVPETYSENQYIYIRLKSHTSLNLAVRLWSFSAWEDRAARELVIFGILLGAILVLAVYNFFIYLSLGDRTYLFYVIYMTMTALFQFRLYGISSVILDLPAGLGQPMNWVVVMASQLGAVMFSRSFLNTRVNSPFLDKLLLCFGALALVMGGLGLTGQYMAANLAGHAFGAFSPLVCIAAGIVLLSKGFLAVRYYLLAWSILAVSSFTFTMGGVLFPSTFFTFHSLLFGSVLEAILLSFALAERIRGLRTERAKLRKQKKKLTELSITDELTGLFNKRWFSKVFPEKIENARRHDQSLALLILDVDHFKKFNDNYGHAIGDNVLAGLGTVISTSVRKTDIPCRYGGEEFCLVLTGSNLEQSLKTSERLRRNFEIQRFKTLQSLEVGATISIGVSLLQPGDDENTLFHRADKALYQAKSQGRNKVVSL